MVTGASAGIGRAVAAEFARHGWNVVLIARGRASLAGTVREVERVGGHPMGVAMADAVRGAADEAARAFGGLDGWVNDAMVTIDVPVQQTSPEKFRRATEVTHLGQVDRTFAALAHMVPRDAGTTVHIASALAYRSIPLPASYCMAKAAVRGSGVSLRSGQRHDGSRVRLTMVQSPAVNPPQSDWARSNMPRKLEPVPPVNEPAAIARHVYRAAHDAPRELWIGA